MCPFGAGRLRNLVANRLDNQPFVVTIRQPHAGEDAMHAMDDAMDYVHRLWDTLVAVGGPYGAVAILGFTTMSVIALLLNRPW